MIPIFIAPPLFRIRLGLGPWDVFGPTIAKDDSQPVHSPLDFIDLGPPAPGLGPPRFVESPCLHIRRKDVHRSRLVDR
jgi:hypothetical protein